MKFGIIGLGRMGCAIARRLLDADIDVVGFDVSLQACTDFEQRGGKLVGSIAEVAQQTNKIWLMLPAGTTIDAVLDELVSVLQANSIIVDGGNSYFRDSIIRAQRLAAHKITYLDCGTSGGLHGEQLGFSLMVGGNETAYKQMEIIFKAIAAPRGYVYVGPSGAGHYVKMVHNGIEYALLQAYAEGFHLLKDGYYKNLDLEQIASVWLHGSIIRSWILQLAYDVFKRDQQLTGILGAIGGGQTGKWMVEEAHKEYIPVQIIEKALEIRAYSQQTDGNYATKLVAMLRHEFGGHELKKINI